MKISPFILLRDSDRRDITERVESRLTDWAATWIPHGPAVRAEGLIGINNTAELQRIINDLEAFRVFDAGRSRVVCIKPHNDRQFADLLLGAGAEDRADALTPIEKDVVAAALEDLAIQVFGAAGQQVTSATGYWAAENFPEYLKPGAAAVHVEISVAGMSIALLLSPEALRSFWSRSAATPATTDMTSVRNALIGLEQGKVPLRAELAAAEMTIGNLASLNVGDVLRLRSRIDEPVTVSVGDSPVTLQANLGLASGSRALQIVGARSE